MGFSWIAICALVVVSSLADEASNAPPGPKLLAHKEVINSAVFASKPLTVRYTIFNVGLGTAFEVELVDNSFVMADFAKVAGMTKVKYDRIGPNSNVTHSIIVTPLKSGVYNFSSAQITYSSQQQLGKNPQVGYTTAPGEVPVYPVSEYERYFTSHARDWMCFAAMTVPSVFVPAFVWYLSHSKYCIKEKRA